LDAQLPSVGAEAAGALGAIGSSAAVPRLLDVARSDEFTAGRAAAQAVARIDPEALTAAAATPDAGSHLHEAADLLELLARSTPSSRESRGARSSPSGFLAW